MRFVGQVFTSDVTLDYNEFVDCEFRGCTLLYHGGTFSLVRTRFTNVRFGLGAAANNTLAFLRLVRSQGPHLVDELLAAAPAPSADQSLTIN
ncbi:MAG: hypothetical protein U1F30_02280 [Steroidobacteraceae bacterium]